jgi:hypothetical protein
MKNFIKRLLCKHIWVQISEEPIIIKNKKAYKKEYKCQKCGSRKIYYVKC